MRSTQVADVATDLRIVIGGLLRRLRQHRDPGDPTVPEMTVLARLDRDGPTTSAELARREQISPQSMGATIATLCERGLLAREPDPTDGRRITLRPTPAGKRILTDRRNQRSRILAEAISTTLTDDEVATLARALPLLSRVVDAL